MGPLSKKSKAMLSMLYMKWKLICCILISCTCPIHKIHITDISKCKRASPESSSSSTEIQSVPNNPALRNKHVSFHFQANNNTDDDPVPDKLNVKVDDWDPARDYQIIPEASKSWNLAMDEYRSAARDHSRLRQLKDAQANRRDPICGCMDLAQLRSTWDPSQRRSLTLYTNHPKRSWMLRQRACALEWTGLRSKVKGLTYTTLCQLLE